MGWLGSFKESVVAESIRRELPIKIGFSHCLAMLAIYATLVIHLVDSCERGSQNAILGLMNARARLPLAAVTASAFLPSSRRFLRAWSRASRCQARRLAASDGRLVVAAYSVSAAAQQVRVQLNVAY